MLRSMYSGISGLKNFQTKLDVIGNNISNVNTFGFKKERVTFSDALSQTMTGASAPSETRGGTNPAQVGLGAKIASIDKITTQGNLQSTNRQLDMAISGEGYFVVGAASPFLEQVVSYTATGTVAGITGTTTVEASVDQVSYTRAGNFYLDKEGFMVNANGLYVLGQTPRYSYVYNAAGVQQMHPDGTPVISESFDTFEPMYIPTNAKDLTIGSDGKVSYIAGEDISVAVYDRNGNVAGSTVIALAGDLVTAGQLTLAKFPNAGGLSKQGDNLLTETANSGAPLFTVSGEQGAGTIATSYLEMSNVDLSEELTEMIVAQRAFQANTRIITTSDEILQELVNLKR